MKELLIKQYGPISMICQQNFNAELALPSFGIFSTSSHQANICKYNSVSVKVRHILITGFLLDLR